MNVGCKKERMKKRRTKSIYALLLSKKGGNVMYLSIVLTEDDWKKFHPLHIQYQKKRRAIVLKETIVCK